MYNEKISYKLIGILFLTFMVGFLYCFIILPNIQNNFNIELDGEQYNIIAQNIYQGKGFFFDKGQEPIISDARYTLGRPPLYPYFLVLIYLIFGQKIWIVQLIQIVISTVTGYVIYKIANKIFEERVALFSAIVYGIHPLFFWYPPRLYTETILIFFSSAFAWFLAYVLKFLFHTQRPFDLFPNVVSLFPETGYAFPSGHATFFMALAFALFFNHKKIGLSTQAGYLFIFFAFLIGASRIIAGVHFPVDILGGFVLGFFIAFFVKNR
ncbi:MAG: Phosphoesterase PA-phosphatase releated protein [Parcubacteria group bacterium GW2011_GWD2_35_7]|nr:MAG: Phosphoesterase PA-phosphatase releated protein [Parcubacteria group bacterium GW2011_GWD2_35_7]